MLIKLLKENFQKQNLFKFCDTKLDSKINIELEKGVPYIVKINGTLFLK